MQIVIIVIYLILTVLIGLYSKKKMKTATDFHGVGLGVSLCVVLGAGNWLGGTATTGCSEYGYIYGISASWYTITVGLSMMLLGILFAKLYRSFGEITVSGIFEKVLGVNARIVVGVVMMLGMLVTGTTTITAAGLLGVTLFDINFVLAAAILGVVFIVYTNAGGIMSVGYTNMMHVIVLYGGTLLALFVVLRDVDGFSGLASSLPESYFNISKIGVGKIFAWFFAGFIGACTSQAGLQPILAAKDEKTAKRSAIAIGLAVAPYGIATTILGMAAFVLYPEIPNTKLALPVLLMGLNPIIGGIVMAGLFAAVLSTIAPIILAIGTIFAKDIYQRKMNPECSQKSLLNVTRIISTSAGIICVLGAIMMYENASLLDIVYFGYALRGGILVALFFSLYWSKTTERAAVATICMSSVAGTAWIILRSILGSYPIHPQLTETYIAIIVAVITILVTSKLDQGKELESQAA